MQPVLTDLEGTGANTILPHKYLLDTNFEPWSCDSGFKRIKKREGDTDVRKWELKRRREREQVGASEWRLLRSQEPP